MRILAGIRMVVPAWGLLLLATVASCSSEDKTGSAGSTDRSGGRVDAADIIARMQETYVSCDSYKDEATIETTVVLEHTERSSESVQRLYTDFDRSGRFRFELRSSSPFQREWIQSVVWARGDDIRSYGFESMFSPWGVDKEEVEPSWETVAQDIAGVSLVPAMLMPDKFKGVEAEAGIGSATDLEVVGEEEVNGVSCFKISGKLPGKIPQILADNPFLTISENARITAEITLWIGRQQKLLRKAEQSVTIERLGEVKTLAFGDSEIPTIHTVTTTSFRPRIDQDHAWHDFAIGIPGVAEDDEFGLARPDAPDFKPTKKSPQAARKIAAKVVRQTTKAYAACESYIDQGVIETAAVGRVDRVTEAMTFRTAFVRPGRFRYEYRLDEEDEGRSRHIIWADGGEVRSWWYLEPGIESWESVKLPIQRAVAGSNVSVCTIPGLLMPNEVGESPLTRAKDLMLLGYQDLDGKRCYKLRGKDYLGRFFSIWIEKKRKLIRRVEGRSLWRGSQFWVTTTYQPRIDEKVSKKRLKFDPPE